MRGRQWFSSHQSSNPSRSNGDLAANWLTGAGERGEIPMRRTRFRPTAQSKRGNRTPDQVSLLLCDDHPLLLIGLKTFLTQHDGFLILGEATDGETLLHLASRLQPHIVIVDMSTAKRNNFQVLNQLNQTCPDTRIIILTNELDPLDLFRSLQAGVQGYLLKTSDPNLLIEAILSVHSGKPWLPPDLIPPLISVITDFSKALNLHPIQTLSLREREILRLVAEGLSNKEIANQLHLSVQTVKVYLTRVFQKLGVRNRVEAAQYAHLLERES